MNVEESLGIKDCSLCSMLCRSRMQDSVPVFSLTEKKIGLQSPREGVSSAQRTAPARRWPVHPPSTANRSTYLAEGCQE